MVADVEVVELLELLKQAMAQTTIAVATTPPAINASVERNSARDSPAGGPGGKGGAAAGGGETSLGAGLVVTPPDVPAPPLSPWASRVGRAGAVVCAGEETALAPRICAASASANQFLDIGALDFVLATGIQPI
jgi:hypothetical protein